MELGWVPCRRQQIFAVHGIKASGESMDGDGEAFTFTLTFAYLCRELHDLRPWNLLAVTRPCRHQLPALLDQVAPPVGRFGLVGESMRQCLLADLAGEVGRPGGPVAEFREQRSTAEPSVPLRTCKDSRLPLDFITETV